MRSKTPRYCEFHGKIAAITPLALERAHLKALRREAQEWRAKNAKLRAEIDNVLMENIRLKLEIARKCAVNASSNLTVLPTLTEKDRDLLDSLRSEAGEGMPAAESIKLRNR